MRRKSILVVVLLLTSSVSAELIRDGIDIDFVTIGNPGNPGDTRTAANPNGGGAVDYEYQIGKYEVTNGQWAAFTSAAGAPTGNLSNAYNKTAYWAGTDIPNGNVSWYEAAQFCNYLTTGDKSLGAYQFNGNNTNPGDFLGIGRDSAVSDYGIVYVIPTQNEWYKAAYYTGSGYSTYANGTDVAPSKGVDTNYTDIIGQGQPWEVSTGTMEQNDTFNMMGNFLEWNETFIGGFSPVFRGGSYNLNDSYLGSSYRQFTDPYDEIDYVGFRIASVPEPTTLLLLGLGGLIMRKRSVH